MKKTKKLPAVERIAMSLDSIDASLRRLAEAYENVAVCARRQVEMGEEHLGIARAGHELHRALYVRIQVARRPWWEKLLGIKDKERA